MAFISDSSGNPRAGQGRTGKAIVNYVKAVRPAYPDAAVLITTGDTGRGLVRILGWYERKSRRLLAPCILLPSWQTASIPNRRRRGGIGT